MTDQDFTALTANTLHLEQVRIDLAGRELLSLSKSIAAGEVFTVMGPSGSGKSSLLAFIAGFLDPAFDASGQVLLDTEDVTRLPAEQRRIGLLFQDPLLFPHLSVGGNLAFGIPAKRRSEKHTIIEEGLHSFGLGGFTERDPATLSGGQKARVALLRLLLSEPRAILLDEPFNKLDADLRRELREQVFTRLRATGLPVILVTHDREDADAAGGEILSL
jgi:putative thiamine transport system ATP-binding protein